MLSQYTTRRPDARTRAWKETEAVTIPDTWLQLQNTNQESLLASKRIALKHGISELFVMAISLVLMGNVGAIGRVSMRQAQTLLFSHRVGKLPEHMRGYEARALMQALKTNGRYAYRKTDSGLGSQVNGFYARPLAPNVSRQKITLRADGWPMWRPISIGSGPDDEMSEDHWRQTTRPVGEQLFDAMRNEPMRVLCRPDIVKAGCPPPEDPKKFAAFDAEYERRGHAGGGSRRTHDHSWGEARIGLAQEETG
jgi:hypothetical protein